MTKHDTSAIDGVKTSAVGPLAFISVIFSALVLLLIILRTGLYNSGDISKMSYHIRGKLARTLYNRLQEDEEERNCTHQHVCHFYPLRIRYSGPKYNSVILVIHINMYFVK